MFRNHTSLLEAIKVVQQQVDAVAALTRDSRAKTNDVVALDNARLAHIQQLEKLLANECAKNAALEKNLEAALLENTSLQQKMNDAQQQIERLTALRKHLETQVNAQTKKIRSTGVSTPPPPNINCIFTAKGPLAKNSPVPTARATQKP